jgi:predicted CXXCH cytochrome family protein
MKGLRIGFIVFAAGLITVGLSGMAFAFHSGGVAECMGCHNIHDAKSTSALLIGTDASSTCLDCHGESGASGYHIATPDADMPAGTPPGNRTPGGDFGWLKKGYTWSPRSGTTETSFAEKKGHNIIAADFGYIADAQNATAPGGDMDATLFSCTSCHDQHGKLRRTGTDAAPTFGVTGGAIIGSGSYYNSVEPAAGQAVGAYRILRGTGSTAGPGGKTFTAVFNASAPSTYNRTEAVSATRVAYGAGTSDWCAACHPDMHSGTSSKMTHPVNQGLSADVVANYNAYKGSGDMTGTVASSFDSIVPFQTNNTSNYTTLKALANPTTVTTGPATSDRVMCLSCHRAHATGWDYMARWNATGNEFIAVDGVWPGTDSPSTIAASAKYAQGRTVAETTKAYNDTTMHYGAYQRSLCNKCHAKD